MDVVEREFPAEPEENVPRETRRRPRAPRHQRLQRRLRPLQRQGHADAAGGAGRAGLRDGRARLHRPAGLRRRHGLPPLPGRAAHRHRLPGRGARCAAALHAHRCPAVRGRALRHGGRLSGRPVLWVDRLAAHYAAELFAHGGGRHGPARGPAGRGEAAPPRAPRGRPGSCPPCVAHEVTRMLYGRGTDLAQCFAHPLLHLLFQPDRMPRVIEANHTERARPGAQRRPAQGGRPTERSDRADRAGRRAGAASPVAARSRKPRAR